MLLPNRATPLVESDAFVFGAACVATYFIWRLWRFTISPFLDRSAPQTYPYIVPYFGHLYSFLSNSERLYSRASRFFGDDQSPFQITLAGSTVYIVTDPHDAAKVFKGSISYSFDMFLVDIMTAFGTTREGAERITEHRTPSSTGGRSQTISQKAHDMQIKQTSGQDLLALGSEIAMTLDQLLLRSPLRQGAWFQATGHGTGRLSLRNWLAEISIDAVGKAYFGDALSLLDPDLPEVLTALDELSWQIFFKIPKMYRGQLNGKIERVMQALRSYLDLPLEARPCKAWFTTALEQEYKMAGISQEDTATQLLFLYWGINTNGSKICFWMMSYLLTQPNLLEEIGYETSFAVRDDGTVDHEYVYRSCPQLNAVWLEILRTSAASTVLRTITEDTVLGDKLLRKDNKLLISARQLHLQQGQFGHDAESFDHRRFLGKPELERSKAYRPFGGGATMCPGRGLAKHVTLNMIASILRHFDLHLDAGQQMPKARESKPAIGIVSGEGDLYVYLTPRTKS